METSSQARDWSNYTLDQLKADKQLQLLFIGDYAKKFNKAASSLTFGCGSCLTTYWKHYMKNIDKPKLSFRIVQMFNGISLGATINGYNHLGNQFILSHVNANDTICQVFHDFHLITTTQPIFHNTPTEAEMEDIRDSEEYKSYLDKYNLIPSTKEVSSTIKIDKAEDNSIDYSTWALKDLRKEFPEIKAKTIENFVSKINQ